MIEGNTTTDLIPRNPSLTEEVPSAVVSDEAAIALSLLRLTEGADELEASGSTRDRSLWSERAKWEAIR